MFWFVLFFLFATLAGFIGLERSRSLWLYCRNVWVGIDQMLNTLFGGDPDETISSRCAKRVTTCKLCKRLCRWLNRIDPGHCEKSLEADEGGSDVYRKTAQIQD